MQTISKPRTKRKSNEHKLLYITIPQSGIGSWSMTYSDIYTGHGGRSTMCRTGYGDYRDQPDIMDGYRNGCPIIRFDLNQIKTVFKAIDIPNTLRPANENQIYSGTMKSYFDALRVLGIRIDCTIDLDKIGGVS